MGFQPKSQRAWIGVMPWYCSNSRLGTVASENPHACTIAEVFQATLRGSFNTAYTARLFSREPAISQLLLLASMA